MLTAPLPYMLGGLEIAPPVRLAFFTAVISALQVSEGPGGWIWHTFFALGTVQLVAWASANYFVASFAARASARFHHQTRLIAVLLLCVAVLAIALTVPIYETPMSSEAEYSRLSQVLF